MTSTTAAPRLRYGRLWAGLPRELLYLLIAFPIATVGFAVTIALFSGGVGTIVTLFIGVIVVIAGLYVARGLGTLDLRLLRWTGRPAIVPPDWQDAEARSGFFGWVRAVLGNAHYWLYLLWAAVLDFAVSTFTWTIAITWTAVGLGGVSYWFWERFPPDDGAGHRVYPAQLLLEHLGLPVGGADPQTVDGVAFFVLGLIFLATLPFMTRGLVTLHWLAARGLLGAFRSEALTREVATLSASRTAAVAAEGTALRRLERDIHDGPQQRLVRLQMDLAAADRQLDADPAAARALLGEALQQSRDALDELRALSRGFAPPILLDRGLLAALESLAARSTVPARVVSSLPDGSELPPELERNAYFIAAEAVTNAAKHADAQHIEILVGSGSGGLELTVTDDGRGGAEMVADHGLAGLHERVQGLGGTLELTSPVGGPTTVAVRLPF